MDITKEGTRITVFGLKDGKRLMPILPSMEGRKVWLKNGGFSFEATPINLELFKRAFPDAPLATEREPVAPLPAVAGPKLSYATRRKNYGHQTRALVKWGPLPCFALFMEMGTGKTKVLIDKAGELWCDRMITGVLVVAKKGVHEDWIDDHIPLNLGPMVPWFGWAWDGKPISPKLFNRDKLAYFAINIDALRFKSGEKAALDFIRAHNGDVLMVIDESQDIKNPNAKRTKVCYSIGALCRYRAIMTGTPIARNLLDEWSQFKFLDERIIGMRYAATFKAEFCVVDKASHIVVGAKNVERFYARVDKWNFRVTKEEELDLPPKVYDIHSFNMSDEQKKHYDNIKHTFMTELDSGERMSVTHVATMFMRLQQITCGVFTDEEGIVHRLNHNTRLEALRDIIEARQGKVVIWARFQTDIEDIMSMFEPGEAVAYYGATSSQQRTAAKSAFLDPRSHVRFFVSNPQVGGVGLDGMQFVSRTAIFYSNSFNAIDRWQAEDRIHRIGTTGSVTYIDVICKNSIDKRMLTNLRAKKSLSDLVLDDIRRVLEA